MSAFIVSDQTINEIVSWIHYTVANGFNNRYYYDVQGLVMLGYKLNTKIGCKRLAEEMFTLNCDSVEQRYGEGEAEKFRPLDFNFQYSPPTITIYQVLKSLRCFLYQCCEGTIPKQNALYHTLDKLSLEISYTIVSNTELYEKANWSH